MPANPRTTKKLLIVLALLALGLTSIVLEVQEPRPAQAHHLCGNTGSPYGPFDLQTYEDGNYKTTYARSMELAGFNQLVPDRPGFALPALEGHHASPYIPPVLLKAIAWIESGWAQASYDPPVQYGQVGPVLSSHDCGYGIMQVTSGMQNVSGVPNLDQAMIGGHYAFNIARGARILAEKWNGAPEFRPVVGSRNSQIIEDWYYALWSYNGFASKNHPLSHDPNRPPYLCNGTQPRGSYPYQELVFGCVTHPPVRGGVPLWPAQSVHLPNLADPAFGGLANWDAFNSCAFSLQCASMNIPTPNPWHVDPTVPSVPREQVIGVPTVALSAGSLSLSALPGGESLATGLTIANAGSGVLNWRARTSASWLRISRLQGVSLGSDLGATQSVISVQASAAGLPAGTHGAEITIESLYAHGTPVSIPVSFYVSVQAGVMLTGDFTGDGMSDAVLPCCTDYMTLWFARPSTIFGVSTFRPWPGYGLTLGTWQTGDFNADGKTDLIHLLNSDYVRTWLSNGDGTFSVGFFSPGPGYWIDGGSWHSGDINGDGRTDLMHLLPGDYIRPWLSNGDGSFSVGHFSPGAGYWIEGGAWRSGDFNGDGKTDLTHFLPGGYVRPWLSNGDGSFSVGLFSPGPGYWTEGGTWHVGDFNGDYKTDFLHMLPSDYIRPWLSNGDGSFTVGFFSPGPGYWLQGGSWQLGDFNGDGRSDLVHLLPGDYVRPWLSDGTGSFNVGFFSPRPGYSIPSGSWHSGDFNGDRRTDLIHRCCHYVNVWISAGGGSFTVDAFNP